MKYLAGALLFLIVLLGVLAVAIAGPATMPSPSSGATLLVVALAPPIFLWSALATRRSWRDDDAREQRAARKALVRLYAVISLRGSAATRAELESWRTHVIHLWKVDHAAPSAAEIAAHPGGDLVALREWAMLWQEAEEAMYSPRGELPADWLGRAKRAAEKFRLGSRSLPIPKRRRHWLPLATAAAMVLGGANLDGADSSPREATQPVALPVRINEARVFAQQEKWGPAAANWTAAYLLNPRDESVAAGVRVGLGKIENPDPRLVRMITGPWYDRVVGRLSPAQWERLAAAGAVATGVCLSAAVVLLYFDPSAHRRRTVFACALLVGGTTLVAFACVRHYGPLANPQAAFVAFPTELHAIPSEIAATQPAVALSPGMIAVVDRSFLGWDHVSVRGKATGWIRTENAVWLYRTRDNAQIRADYEPVQ